MDPWAPSLNHLSHHRFLSLLAQAKCLLLNYSKFPIGSGSPCPRYAPVTISHRILVQGATLHFWILSTFSKRKQDGFLWGRAEKASLERKLRPGTSHPLLHNAKPAPRGDWQVLFKTNDSSLCICLMTHPLYLSNKLHETFKQAKEEMCDIFFFHQYNWQHVHDILSSHRTPTFCGNGELFLRAGMGHYTSSLHFPRLTVSGVYLKGLYIRRRKTLLFILSLKL